MQIKFKTVIYGVQEMAPFTGAILIGHKWSDAFTTQVIEELQALKTVSKSHKYLLDDIKSDPVNQGVIFGGLEWSLQAEELYELIKYSAKIGLQVAFHTSYTLEEFEQRLGEAWVDLFPISAEVRANMFTDDDRMFYRFIARNILDYVIKGDYMIISDTGDGEPQAYRITLGPESDIPSAGSVILDTVEVEDEPVTE